ncbi:c-type cytochrome [Pseudahrensia aquimaris]|uniref:C-type cytochrome n=1 Tax=Pseudahrensia aquimaris TaxID=744461 RepID=A0ABW3FH57_9HYPH
MSTFMKLTKASVLLGGFLLAGTTGAVAEGYAEGDAAAGEKVFKRCASCHMVGPDAKAKVGPPLTAVFGRTMGASEEFEGKYGDSLVALGATGAVWTPEEMFAYLEDPRKYLRAKLDDNKAKSKMAFKLKKDDQRNDVIAYIKTFSPDYKEGEGSTTESN